MGKLEAFRFKNIFYSPSTILLHIMSKYMNSMSFDNLYSGFVFGKFCTLMPSLCIKYITTV